MDLVMETLQTGWRSRERGDSLGSVAGLRGERREAAPWRERDRQLRNIIRDLL